MVRVHGENGTNLLALQAYRTTISGYKARGRPRTPGLRASKKCLNLHKVLLVKASRLEADRKLQLSGTPMVLADGQNVR